MNEVMCDYIIIVLCANECHNPLASIFPVAASKMMVVQNFYPQTNGSANRVFVDGHLTSTFPATASEMNARTANRPFVHSCFSFVDGLYTVTSLLQHIIPPNSLNGLHILAWKDAPIFQTPAPKVEQQRNGRACGFQIVDDLR